MNNGMLKRPVIFLLCLLSACDRPVKLTQTTPAADSTISSLPAMPSVPAEVVPETDAAVWPENLPLLAKPYQVQKSFQTFNGRAKVHYEGKGQNQDFNANIRIQKDQQIWMSINALGLLEIFRAVLTTEKLEAINRLDKVYYEFPLSEVSRILPVAADFQTIQSLLTAGVLGQRGAVLQTIPTGDRLSLLLQRPDFEQSLVLAQADTLLQEQTLYNQSAGLRLDISYERYKESGIFYFPFVQTIRVAAPGNNVVLQLNYEKAEFDSEISMPYSVPKKYKKGKLPD